MQTFIYDLLKKKCFSDGTIYAKTAGILLFDSGMFPPDWRCFGSYYRQPSERLETIITDIQRTGIAVFVIFLVFNIIITRNACFAINTENKILFFFIFS